MKDLFRTVSRRVFLEEIRKLNIMVTAPGSPSHTCLAQSCKIFHDNVFSRIVKFITG